MFCSSLPAFQQALLVAGAEVINSSMSQWSDPEELALLYVQQYLHERGHSAGERSHTRQAMICNVICSWVIGCSLLNRLYMAVDVSFDVVSLLLLPAAVMILLAVQAAGRAMSHPHPDVTGLTKPMHDTGCSSLLHVGCWTFQKQP
jgi:hypothetical protein